MLAFSHVFKASTPMRVCKVGTRQKIWISIQENGFTTNEIPYIGRTSILKHIPYLSTKYPLKNVGLISPSVLNPTACLPAERHHAEALEQLNYSNDRKWFAFLGYFPDLTFRSLMGGGVIMISTSLGFCFLAGFSINLFVIRR